MITAVFRVDYHLNVARTESKRLILEITTWHEKAEQNHDEYNRLNHSFEFWNRKSQEHLLKKANLEASRIKLELQHSEWLVEKLKMAHQVTTELRSSLRQELEFEEGKEAVSYTHLTLPTKRIV